MTVIRGSQTFNVPAGRNAIIREIEIIPGEVLVDSSATLGTIPLEMLLSFFIDGGAVPHNAEMGLRLLAGSNRYPVFFPTPVEAEIEVILKMDQTVFTVAETGINCTVILHGQLILSDDRPSNFIVSTQRGKKS